MKRFSEQEVPSSITRLGFTPKPSERCLRETIILKKKSFSCQCSNYKINIFHHAFLLHQRTDDHNYNGDTGINDDDGDDDYDSDDVMIMLMMMTRLLARVVTET